jgi:hypothetical protein
MAMSLTPEGVAATVPAAAVTAVVAQKVGAAMHDPARTQVVEQTHPAAITQVAAHNTPAEQTIAPVI